MPRIDPMKLLVCLSVLLAQNGGIRNAGEVKRLVNLMAKFSKKLVSKCIYIQILKCTETVLLGQFMQTGGWSLVHMWLVDGIGSKNWPLIQELLELLLCCPVDVERLKINSTPRLVKSLSTDSAHESVRVLATKLVEQWLCIVKAPKQMSPMIPLNQNELPSPADGTHVNTEGVTNVSAAGLVGKHSVGELTNGMRQEQHNGYGPHTGSSGETNETEETDAAVENVAANGNSRKTFQLTGEQQQQTVPYKKTSLVLKFTTENGKQVVAKVVKPSKKSNQSKVIEHEEDDDGEDDEEDDEDQEEVVVNIESSKSSDTKVNGMGAAEHLKEEVDGRKHELENGTASVAKERSSSSSKDQRHHSHRDRDNREKDRKSGGSGRSSSKSSSGSGHNSSNSSSSSSKHKSSGSSSTGSKSSSSSSSRSKDKERHGSSSSSSSSKHKSSSSSSSSKSSSGSSSKSGSSSSSSSDKHRDHRDKSNHSSSSGTSSSNNNTSREGGKDKDTKHHSSSSPSSKTARKNSHDDDRSNDSGSETSSIATNTSADGQSKSAKTATSTTIPSKKASISIEVRNPENRAKTVKTYNSQFRSHGLIEEAPPPPSRKGLKKPTSSSSTSSTNPTAAAAAIGSTATGTVKRSSPMRALVGSPVEKKPKEDPSERPGSIKLIPAKRQHALVESDMFMDALSATLRKDVKKRKRRTSGSESSTTTTTTAGSTATVGSKPGSETSSASKPDGSITAKPGSPRNEEAVPEAGSQPTTPTSPKIPTIAPMSFYRDTLAEQEDEENGSDSAKDDGEKKDHAEGVTKDGEERKRSAVDTNGADGDAGSGATADNDDEDEAPVVKKSKRMRCELNDEDDDGDDEKAGETKKVHEEGDVEGKTELLDEVTNDVEKKMAEEAVEGESGDERREDGDAPTDGKKPPGPGCGPDGPPGVLVIHRRKGPKKQLRWRAAEELEEVRYFELDVTERCNVTKSFTDMKQMERVDERQKFMLSRKVGSEDIMVERTAWRPLVLVDNVPASPDGSQSLERNIQRQRERGCLQALYFNKHMIPDSPFEPDPADTYQTADPVHIPLEDVTGNPDSVNDFISVPWPDPKSTPPHESAAFNSPFFPSDLPPGAGFGPGGFPPPFAPGVAATIGPGPWNLGPPALATGPPLRSGVLPPGMFPLNQPPPGLVGGPSPAAGGGGGSPNILNLPMNMPPNMPPPGMFPGAGNFNAPPPEFGGHMGGGRGSGGPDFRNGPPPQQQWVTGNSRPFGGPGGFGNRGGGPAGGNWNNRNPNGGNRNGAGGPGDRGRDDGGGRGNYRGHWVSGGSRGHNNNNNRGRKW